MDVSGRPVDPERYSPVTVEVMLCLLEGPARSFMVASALGAFVHEDGGRRAVRSGRDAAGSLITPYRLPTILGVLGISEGYWRRLVRDWEARYVAHRCGRAKVCLFTRPLLADCPACGAELLVTDLPRSTRQDRTRDPDGRWTGTRKRTVQVRSNAPYRFENRTVAVRGMNRAGSRTGTDAPHPSSGSLQGDEVGLAVGPEVPDFDGEGLS